MLGFGVCDGCVVDLKVPSSWPLYSRPGPRGRLQLGFDRYTSSSRAQQVDADWAFADCFDTHAYLGLRVHRSWALLEQSSGESNDCPFKESSIIIDRRVMPTSACVLVVVILQKMYLKCMSLYMDQMV